MNKNFEISAKDLFEMRGNDFYDFLEFCRAKSDIELFKNLYKFLDQYSYDFAAEYIGEDL